MILKNARWKLCGRDPNNGCEFMDCADDDDDDDDTEGATMMLKNVQTELL